MADPHVIQGTVNAPPVGAKPLSRMLRTTSLTKLEHLEPCLKILERDLSELKHLER